LVFLLASYRVVLKRETKEVSVKKVSIYDPNPNREKTLDAADRKMLTFQLVFYLIMFAGFIIAYLIFG
jgi:hypothetical protein